MRPRHRFRLFSLLILASACSSSVEHLDANVDASSDSSTQPDSAEGRAFVGVNATFQSSCARRSDGAATCWGEVFPTGMRFEPTVDKVHAALAGAYTLRDGRIEYFAEPDVSDIIVALRTAPPGQYISMDASGAPVCAILEDRTVRCWGESQEPEPPPLEPPYVSVATGGRFACVETESRRFGCWSPFDPVTPPPLPDRNLVQVVPGADYLCGLDTDGRAECWTNDTDQQELLGPPEPGPFVQLAAGALTVCGLRDDGTVACWGLYPFGHLEPPGQRYSQISVGSGHVCAITLEGDLSCWGDNTHGQVTVPEF